MRPDAIWGLAVAVAVLILTTVPSIQATDASATIKDGQPTVLSWNATFDERLGIFDYRITATDPNGIEDLDHIELHFVNEFGGATEHIHRDHNAMPDGRASTTWDGSVTRGLSTTVVYRIELHVVDVNDVHHVSDRPYTTVDQTMDDATNEERLDDEYDPRERPERDVDPEEPILPGLPIVPLSAGIQLVSTPMGFLVWALGMTVTAGLLLLTIGRRSRADDDAPPARARVLSVKGNRRR